MGSGWGYEGEGKAKQRGVVARLAPVRRWSGFCGQDYGMRNTGKRSSPERSLLSVLLHGSADRQAFYPVSLNTISTRSLLRRRARGQTAGLSCLMCGTNPAAAICLSCKGALSEA